MRSHRSDPAEVGPYAGKAQALRRAALAAILREQALRHRRRAQRRWAAALLTAAGITAGVFQSCSGARGIRDAAADPDQPLLFSDKGKTRGGDRTRSRAGAAREEPEPVGKSAFDQAATDLQALFDQMGREPSGDGADENPSLAAAEVPPRLPARRSAWETAAVPPAGRERPGAMAAADDTMDPPNTQPDPPGEAAPPAAAGPGPEIIPPEPPPRSGDDVSTGNPAARPMNPASPPSSPRVDAPMLALPTVALCRRVESFGRYTPFTSNRFLAGRVNPAIVYAEVDHFTQLAAADLDITSLPGLGALDPGSLLVELSISTELFHADGSRQWRSGEAVVRDQARTRRRDFYLVQRIDLPANLSVGRYNLKVTVRDRLASGSGGGRPEVESIIPIQIVADAGLLGN